MIKRIIRWESGGRRYAKGYIFGDHGWTVTDYAKLVNQAKEDFPGLTDDDIELSRVTKSLYMNRFKTVEFRLEPTQTHPEYQIWDKWDFELA